MHVVKLVVHAVIDNVICKYDTNTLVTHKSFYLCTHAVLLTHVGMHMYTNVCIHNSTHTYLPLENITCAYI